MSYKIQWDASGEHKYETGVDHAVLYPIDENGDYSNGYAWNGISSVNESPSGAEATPVWADNIKYLNLYSAEEFGATIEAYTYPDEFAECDGSAESAPGVYIGQQSRKTFGLAYRSRIGNDTMGDEYGEKIHLIYGAKASPSQRSYSTVNDSPEAATMSWELTTTPIAVSGMKPTSLITIDSTKTDAAKFEQLKQILYGTPAHDTIPAVYKVTEDSTYNSLVTYYTRSGAGTNESPYVYTEATGIDAFAAGTTYYEKVSDTVDPAAAVDPRLPLPDEVISILA